VTDLIRDRIAAALYERERPPRDPHWADAYAMDVEVFEAMADTALATVKPELDRLAAVAALYEQWVKAGPPPLGTLIARWWDKRLAEMGKALGVTEAAP